MDKKIKYYHGVSQSMPFTFSKIEKILNDGAILSRSKQEKNYLYNWYIGYNGNDYISVCEHRDNFDGNSYNNFIRNNVSFELDLSNLDICETIMTSIPYNKLNYSNTTGLNRFSDMDDEIQVKDEIQLSKVLAITFPTNMIIESGIKDTKTILKYLEKLKLLMSKYQYDFPIYDIDSKLNTESKEYGLYLEKSIESYLQNN